MASVSVLRRYQDGSVPFRSPEADQSRLWSRFESNVAHVRRLNRGRYRGRRRVTPCPRAESCSLMLLLTM
jgi:hypothetical protein